MPIECAVSHQSLVMIEERLYSLYGGSSGEWYCRRFLQKKSMKDKWTSNNISFFPKGPVKIIIFTFGPHLVSTCAHLFPTWSHLVPTQSHLVSTWSPLGLHLVSLGLAWPPLRPHKQKKSRFLLVVPTWSQLVLTWSWLGPNWSRPSPAWFPLDLTWPHLVPTSSRKDAKGPLHDSQKISTWSPKDSTIPERIPKSHPPACGCCDVSQCSIMFNRVQQSLLVFNGVYSIDQCVSFFISVQQCLTNLSHGWTPSGVGPAPGCAGVATFHNV